MSTFQQLGDLSVFDEVHPASGSLHDHDNKTLELPTRGSCRIQNQSQELPQDHELVLLPGALNFTDYPDLCGREDRTALILDKIIQLHNFYNTPQAEYVNISHQTISGLITRHAYTYYGRPAIQDLLCQLGIVECDGEYSAKKHYALGWRLSLAFRGGYKHWRVTEPSLITKIRANRISIQGKPTPKTQLAPEYAGLLAWQEKLKINETGAIRAVKSRMAKKGQTDITPYIDSIHKIVHKKWQFIVDPIQTRLYTNVTNACKEIRDFLTIDDNHLSSADLKNSQLFFLCRKIERQKEKEEKRESHPKALHHSPLGSKQDYRRFRELVLNGRFYNYLMEEYNRISLIDKIQSRADFKVKFFTTVLYGNHQEAYANVDHSPLSRLFATLFPTVWQFLLDNKRGENWKQLSIDMQREEADFIIRRVCGRILREHPEIPLVTIHDAIMTTKENIGLVVRVIMEEAGEDCQPTVAIEDPKTGEKC